MIDLLIITLILVYILDLSGLIGEMERILQKRLKRKVVIRKPWSCSLCMTFWTGIAYLLATGSFSIPMLGYVCLLSFMTPFFNDMLLTIRELLLRIMNRIGNGG